MKAMNLQGQRLTSRVIDLDAGISIVRYKSAAAPDAALISITLLPGQDAKVAMLGDVRGGITATLSTPGEFVVVQSDSPVRLVATIVTSPLVIKADVVIDCDQVSQLLARLSEPAQMSAPMLASAPRPAPAGDEVAPVEPAPPAAPASWFKWADRPSNVMLSVSVAVTEDKWLPAALADDVDVATLKDIWGFRWALVGSGRRNHELRATGMLADNTVIDQSGQSIVVPNATGTSLVAVQLYVRLVGTTDWSQILQWQRPAG